MTAVSIQLGGKKGTSPENHSVSTELTNLKTNKGEKFNLQKTVVVHISGMLHSPGQYVQPAMEN